MDAYEHATQTTKNGFLYIDTSNESGLREKFRIRNFLAPIYPKSQALDSTVADIDQSQDQSLSNGQQQQQQQHIRAIAKKDHQYLYADLVTESPTY